MLGHISRIDEFKGAWRAFDALAPDRLSALRRVATIESIGSSTRIEGSRLTDREVERLLAGLETKGFETRDEPEVAGYAELMDLVFESWRDIAIDENHLKQLHQVLLRHSEKDAWHRGQYKTNANNVAAFDVEGAQIGMVFETASPFETPGRMAELIAWVEAERAAQRLHPLYVRALQLARERHRAELKSATTSHCVGRSRRSARALPTSSRCDWWNSRANTDGSASGTR